MPGKTVHTTNPNATRRPGDGSNAAGPASGSRSGSSRIDLGSVEYLQFLNPDGAVVDDRLPDLDDAEMLRVYRAMVLTRKLDERMLRMQRQGEMGTFAPGLGQEATQIGQVYPLRQEDWYSPSYRSFGAQMWRGWTIDGLMLLWFGFFEGFEIPEGVNDLPFSIVIGSHVPVATGIAMGIRARQDPGVVMVNFGDGASSQGAVAEAMNFAAVYKAPVVFMCENNGWAISTKTDQQAATPDLVRRGPAFGMHAVRADGNDILAMIAATQEAVDHARSGKGPAFVETVTYRMSVHTTADDPTVYRSDDEVEDWKTKCPILRFEKFLRNRGLLDDAAIERIGAECEQEVLDGREKFRARCQANPREIFDYMYETLPPELLEQRDEYLAKLKRLGVD